MRRRGGEAGITLVEMLVVVALIGLMAAISFPAVTSGIDSLRLSSASNVTVSFLNSALGRADRRRQVMEVSILPAERALEMRSAEPGVHRRVVLPDGIVIVNVLPPAPVEPGTPRRFLLYPGGAIPGIAVELANRRGERRLVSVDPITGVPRVMRPTEAAE